MSQMSVWLGHFCIVENAVLIWFTIISIYSIIIIIITIFLACSLLELILYIIIMSMKL